MGFNASPPKVPGSSSSLSLLAAIREASVNRSTLFILGVVILTLGVSVYTGYFEVRVSVTVTPPDPINESSNSGSKTDGSDFVHSNKSPSSVSTVARMKGIGRTRPPMPPSAVNAANPVCNAGDRARWRPGKCSMDSAWLEPWTRSRPNGSWTLVDVGANKGYVIAGWLDVLLFRTQFSPHHLGMLLFNVTMGPTMDGGWLPSHCGGCCECLDAPPPMTRKAKASQVKVYGFEPSVANYKWLASFYTNKDLVTIRNAAAGANSSRVYFPDQPLGVETGKVSLQPKKGYVPVDIVTLNEELGHLNWIDVLSTDAEGYDQDVAAGASKFLAGGKVGVYQFEMYKKDDYKSIFERLKSWGYECYFSTASRRDKSHPPKKPFFRVPMLVRITDCWEEEYQGYIGWVNGLCYNTRVPELEKIFKYLAHRTHKGGSGNCDGKAWQRRKTRKFIEQYVMPLKQGQRSGDRPEEGTRAPEND